MSTMTCRTRKVKTASADVTVLRKPIYTCELLPHGHAGLITINGQKYGLQCLGGDPREGYRLHSVKNGEVYDVDTESGYPVCDCADYTFNERNPVTNPCKHGLALIKL